MAEIVEVPDVVPTATPNTPSVTPDSQPVNTEVPPIATPVWVPVEPSQAPPSVTNEGSSAEVVGPCVTAAAMTTPVDAAETHGSAPSEPHFVQAAALSPAVTHVSPLVEVAASTGAPPADASEPLLTITPVGPAVEEGSTMTVEPSPEAPVPAASASGHLASQELAPAMETASPPSSPAALSVTPAVAHTPAGTPPAMPMGQPPSSMASSFMQPQKVTRQLPKQMTEQLLKQTAAKVSGAVAHCQTPQELQRWAWMMTT